MKLKIDKEFKNLISPLQEDELKQLENNLVNEGWRDNERIITWNGIIVDGHNRYIICQNKNIAFKSIERKFKDKNEVVVWIIENQLGRRNLLPYDRVRLNLKKEAVLKPIALDNQKHPFGKKVPQEMKGSDRYLTKVGYGRVNDKIGKLAKVSRDTVSKVKFIEAKGDEDIKKKLSSGEETINKVYTNLKKKEQRKNIINEFKNAPKLETKDKKYSIILADPPWDFWSSGWKNQTQHYKTMSMEELKNLPVRDLADENC